MKGMEDIELVIKISEYRYNQCKNNLETLDLYEVLADAVKNGTPIDLEGLKSDMKALNCGYPYGLDYLLDCLKKRLGISIIESATKSGEKNDKKE